MQRVTLQRKEKKNEFLMIMRESDWDMEKNNDTDGRDALTDGFHLLIDALKLNDLTTIYGLAYR